MTEVEIPFTVSAGLAYGTIEIKIESKTPLDENDLINISRSEEIPQRIANAIESHPKWRALVND